MQCRERLGTRGSLLWKGGTCKPLNLFLPWAVRLGIGSGLNFRCVEKNSPRQDSLDREQFGKETQPRNEALGIHWAQRAQFELNSSLERKHNRKNEVFSTLLLFYQHNNNTRYLCMTCKNIVAF